MTLLARSSILATLGLMACKGEDDVVLDDTNPTTAGDLALVTTVAQDYATGGFATVSLDDWTVTDGLFLTTGDAALSVDAGVIYQINRYGYDNLRRYTPGEWAAPMWERSTGDRTNPYDAATCSRIFITCPPLSSCFKLSSSSPSGRICVISRSSGIAPDAASWIAVSKSSRS